MLCILSFKNPNIQYEVFIGISKANSSGTILMFTGYKYIHNKSMYCGICLNRVLYSTLDLTLQISRIWYRVGRFSGRRGRTQNYWWACVSNLLNKKIFIHCATDEVCTLRRLLVTLQDKASYTNVKIYFTNMLQLYIERHRTKCDWKS